MKKQDAKWYTEEMKKYEDMMDTEKAGKMCDEVPTPVILAHAYVPWQCYTKAFSPCEALMKGTLFPELYGVYPIPM